MTVDFNSYTDDQLVDYFHQRCLENGGDRTSWLRGKEHSFKQELVNRLPFLSTGKKKAPIYLYIWCLENGVSDFPPCECCGTPVSGIGSKGFHKTCSTECKKILVANTIKTTMTEKYGVDNFTKTESYRKAASEQKKAENLSTIGSYSYSKLCDPAFLVEEYKTKSIRKIASEIGVSSITVHRYLKKFGIEKPASPKKEIVKPNRPKYVHRIDDVGSFPDVDFKKDELFNFIRSLGFRDAVQSDKTVLGSMELDITIPSKKIAIEFNGLYWHSTRFKERRYHLNKTLASQDSGYRLIHIFEDEWDTRKEQVKEKIKSILGVDDRQTVYARKCSVVEIDDIDKISDFYNKNHIQGSAGQSFTFGLEFNGSVVAMMSFKKRSDTEYELSRYATSHRVVGGFSRILKHAKNVLNEMGVKRLISFADRRYSVGNVYASNGWTHESDVGPDYQYVIRDRRVRKQNFRRKYLPEKIEMFDPNLSEVENMRMNGIYQIYDCGLMKFSLEIG